MWLNYRCGCYRSHPQLATTLVPHLTSARYCCPKLSTSPGTRGSAPAAAEGTALHPRTCTPSQGCASAQQHNAPEVKSAHNIFVCFAACKSCWPKRSEDHGSQHCNSDGLAQPCPTDIHAAKVRTKAQPLTLQDIHHSFLKCDRGLSASASSCCGPDM